MPSINSSNNRFINQPVTQTATSYTISQPNDVIIEVTSTTSVVTVTLPAPSSTGNIGKAYVIKDASGGAQSNNIFISPASGLIDGAASAKISSNYGSVQVFCDGANYYSFGSNNSGSFIVNGRVFTSSGTYIPTAGMLYCEVEIVGGGGAGGGASATGVGQWSAGGGGGAGEHAVGMFSSATIAASQAITIGSGGVGSAGGTGGTGGNTSFGALMSANGGAGGVLGPASVGASVGGALGGTGGTGGNYRSPGVPGAGGSALIGSSVLRPGFGGSSPLGAGGVEIPGPSAGASGLGYGSGGSGASLIASSAASAGGSGSAGGVLITEYIATSAASMPVIALAMGSWSQYNGVAGVTGQSSPDGSTSSVTPFVSSSRINFAPMTTNYSAGLTAGANNVTITQSGTYRVVCIMGINSSAGNSACTQIVRNSSTVLAFGVQDCTAASPFFTTVVSEIIISLSVSDTLDFRWSSGLTLLSLEVSIQQLPSATIVPVTIWNPVSGTTQLMSPNNNYYPQSSSLTTFTLPVAAAAGTTTQIAGTGSGGWTLAQNAGQTINFGNQATTTGTGGSVSSQNRYDGVSVLCTVASTQWVVTAATGNLAVV
jgi:hypothetical protein